MPVSTYLLQGKRFLSLFGSSALLCAGILLPQIVNAAALSPDTLPAAIVNAYYEQRITAPTALTLPVSWSVSSGALPSGLALAPAGGYTALLRGNPTNVGTTSFNVMAVGANGNMTSLSYTFVVNNTLGILSSSLPMVSAWVPYTYTLSASGGVAPYRWVIENGTLPTGLVFDGETGRISGVATTGMSSVLTVRVTDATGVLARHDFSLSMVASGSSDTGQATRLANLTNIGVSVHALVKLADDGNSMTQHDSAVYYLGQDGRRHAFPNPNVYFSWYDGFSAIRILSGSDLASIPLGKNVTYHPGVKMVKFLTGNNVYAVASNRGLRWVRTESIAQDLYGNNWRSMVDDIQDTFYSDYTIDLGNAISGLSDYVPSAVRASFIYPSQVLF